MTLSANVQVRFSTQYLTNLSNPGDPSATTINATILTAACDDVESAFPVYCGVNYDEDPATNPLASQHVAVAVDGVIATLATRTGTGGNYARQATEDFIARMRDLALIAGRDRVVPKTDSVVTATSRRRDGESIVRPTFDWPRFDDLNVHPPPTGD